jgi:GT2 family glycosyltransferase
LDRLHLTRRCIESIYAHSDYPFTLLIHDDGSQPATLTYLNELKASHDNVVLCGGTHRAGCAVARNLAFAQVQTEYIFSLDNDMICHPGWLRETMACAVAQAADFVAPLRLDMNGAVWGFAPELVRRENGSVIEIARWYHDLPLALVQSFFGDAAVPTNFISGGAGLYSREAFQALGGFYAGYESGFEDMDFSLNLERQGLTVWAAPRAVLTHDDKWMPQAAEDTEYARMRYDEKSLRRSAERFQARWGVQALPAKYVQSFKERLAGKFPTAASA